MAEEGLTKLVELLREASAILVFTGAGISTGSGIPDFRGPQGVWKKRRPVYFQDFVRSESARIEHWDYKLEAFGAFKNAKPNAAHRALFELEKLGRLEALVTQNIDGLHEAAGNSLEKIIELHGTNRWIECINCGKRCEPGPKFEEFKKTRKPPVCGCGGFLKTATISFGQQMPAAQLNAAFEAAERCDLVVSIGSTLEVDPAASVPRAAHLKKVPYVVMNRGGTAHDGFATLRLEGDVVELVPEAVRLMQGRRNS
jgi:NAD-dependent deacetylase